MNIPHTPAYAAGMQRFALLILAFAVSLASVSAQLNVSLDQVDPSCAGYTNGSLLAIPSGGNGSYSYQWSNGSQSPGLYSLGSGTYSVTVTDSDGNSGTASATISAPAPMQLAIDVSGDACNVTSATLNLNPTGGTAPYTYTWDGASSSGQVQNPSAGYHYATVTDANGCSAGEGISVTAPLSVDVLTQNVVCNGFCDGTVIAEITGGAGPYTFQWSNGATDQIVYGLDPGTYTVVVTDANGCTATDSGTLTEPDAITFTVSLQDSCAGGTQANVVAQGGTGNLTIRWSTGAFGASTFLPEGQHYVYVSDENGCEESDVVIVSDGIMSVVTMNVNATCDSLGSALLCITGGRGPFTYLWSDGQTTIEATDLAPGTYTYFIQDGGGCTFRGSTIITGPDPNDCNGCDAEAGTLTGGTTTNEVCDSTITLTATVDQAPVVPAGYQIIYVLTTTPNNTIIQVGPTPSFVIDTAGVYTIHTLVYDPSTLSLSGIVLGQTMAADIFLQIIAGGGSICAALDLTGTTFTVPDCTTPFGCEGSVAAQLTSQPVCFDGSTVDLAPGSVSGGDVPAGYLVLYLLSTAPGDTIVATSTDSLFTVDAAGTYTIQVLVYNPDSTTIGDVLTPGTTTTADLSDALTQCDDVSAQGAVFEVTLFAPAFVDTTAQQAICPGGTVELNPGGADSLTYAWTPSDVLDDATAASPTATLDQTTTFTVEISQTVNGNTCSVTRMVTAEVAELPTVIVPANVVTCQGETVDVLATTDPSNTVIWSDMPDFSSVLDSDSLLTVPSGVLTTYYVQVTNAAGCTTTDQLTVGDFPVAIATGDDYTICRGDEGLIDADLTSGNADLYELLDGDGNLIESSTSGSFSLIPSASDTYTVIASNAQGCSDTAAIAINLSTVDVELLANMQGDTSIYPGNAVDLEAISNGATMFEFAPDPSYILTGDSTATVLPDSTTTYLVSVVNEFGCVDTAELTVQVLDFVCDRPYLFVPNAFSPDRDNINDVFYIDGVNISEAYYTIYNRWGEQVFESRVVGDEEGWDGTFNGQLVDPDVYGIYVRIICNDGDEFYTQGNVTVIR